MKLSAIRKAQFRRFKNNKIGFCAFILFMIVFVLCLGANFIANDKPLLVKYNNSFYVPVLKTYPETTFGGVFETEAEYKDPIVQQLIKQNGYMLMPPIEFADQTPSLDRTEYPAPPNATNWLGTDDHGRDVLARILYGLRVSLLFGLALTLVGSVIGILVGAVQGYYGGKIDLIGQRLMEVWSGMPQLFMIIILVSLFSPSVMVLFFMMLLFGWLGLVGLVRAEFLKARNFDYVRSAKAMGVSDRNIMFRHILPNALASSLSQLPFILTANVVSLTALDFLGYGLPAGSPSLGELMNQAKNNLDAPWLALSAFFSLTIILSLLIFIGEALRDAFDTRQS
ncbi:binding-protein-dependent transport system inner membrane protein [Moraxella macacae 0408225]|uniref:Binding-protein-dependent transport system inner membrane protein n=1 Tax=Moraxella macacae 0408225 TaxID=1230338 RepID=L2F6R0_9GAMM|nr:ABC transporter permease [Moraxella macacae]ELA08123.1 binding-protein-dependent transport system inner membrane protein [Moraxella macacae 0408225]